MTSRSLEVPLPYRNFAIEALNSTSEAGSLTHLRPAKPLPGRPYCVVFPGYTGDALSHELFNSTALNLGFGVLCANPTWATSTRRMQGYATALLDEANELGIREDQPIFIRGVSFGCDLSLAWLANRRVSPSKIAWVTPCSAALLEHAGKMMGLDVRNDAEHFRHQVDAPVWVQELAHDAIVPHVDEAFLNVSRDTRRSGIAGADHFGAADLPDASIRIAHWFGEGL